MWEHPFAVCLCPVALVREVDLKQVWAKAFSGVRWWLLPSWRSGAGAGWTKAGASCEVGLCQEHPGICCLRRGCEWTLKG